MASQRVLFLCTHNSARSQMAEGFLRARGGTAFEAFSAGSEATSVRPEAIEVMAEIGIDISGQESKRLDRFFGQPFDWAITVCNFNACESCPVFLGARGMLRWDIEDPSAATGSDDDRLAVFRRVRDQLDQHVREFLSTAA
ncbi:MAG TPA: arsenate reductase ArsC [Candidatus Limnocylindria bacterium]